MNGPATSRLAIFLRRSTAPSPKASIRATSKKPPRYLLSWPSKVIDGSQIGLSRKEIHEARIMASMIDDPEKVSEGQMEKWAMDFDSWDVVDGCCGNLFDKTEFAVRKAHEWSKRKEEYIKRAGFVLMAEMAVHVKKASDKTFLDFLPAIVRESSDERNFVKKAVNWALRQIGKRNAILNVAAIKTSTDIRDSDSKSAKWTAADALRELTSASVRKKLQTKKSAMSMR